MKPGSVDHIRRATLPWREDEGLTECGLDAGSHPAITFAEYVARRKEFGKQRSALLTCMTCASTSIRWQAGREVVGVPDLTTTLARHLQRAEWGKDDRLRVELDAIVALIERHRDEFNGYLAARADTVDFALAKQARRRAGR